MDFNEESAKQYAQLLSVSPVVLWMTNEEQKITFINDTWSTWTGLDRPNDLSEALQQGIHPDDVEKTRTAYRLHVSRQEKFEIQYRLTHTSGNMRHCLINGQPYFHKDGGFAGYNGSVLDISDRVLAEEIINEKSNSEKKVLHDFFMQAPAAFCILRGPDHIFELTNPGYRELIGGRDVIGMPVKEALPEIEGQGFFELLDNVFQNNETFIGNELPVTLQRPEGEKISYLNFIYQPFLNARNEVDGILVFAYDVSEIIRSKTIIQNSEQELRSLIESAPFPIGVYHGRDLTIRLANQSIIDVYGKGQDVIGKSYRSLLPELESQSILTEIDSVLDTGVPFHARDGKVILNHGGKDSVFYFNYSFMPLRDANNNVYGIMNTGADVTEVNVARERLEQSERRFRSMADNMPQFVWTSDPEGNLNYYNKAIYKYSGHTNESLEAAGWLSIVHPDDQEENVRLWTESVQTGNDFVFEHRFRNMNGEYRWQYSKAVPLKDEDGIIYSWVGISSDIHDQKNFSEELEKLVDERTALLKQVNYDLERSNHELSQFAFVASHDLQEPLRKIMTFVDRMNDDKSLLPEKSQTYLNKIDASAQRMSQLINDILQFSAAGKVNEAKYRVELDYILKNELAELDLEIQKKNAIIEYDSLPAIQAIPSQMQQLIHNLLSNALKFAKKDEPVRISIRTELVEGKRLPVNYMAPAKQYYKITFKDTGIGFEQQYADLIFTIFQRLHQKSAYEGTGIGLALCKRIMDNHHGFIHAESTEGNGATFFLYFPAD